MELEKQISKNEINISAGLLVIQNNKILLVAQKNVIKRECKYSIPKGKIEKKETPLAAAIRETFEETGLHIPTQYINKRPYILNIKTLRFKKRIIYFLTTLPNNFDTSSIKILDHDEIYWSGFVDISIAQRKIQPFQKPIIIHALPNRMPLDILELLENEGYIKSASHPLYNIKVYNYTSKCKKDEFWNEITMRCRGLILDKYGYILYHPFKKFFEYSQIYHYFKPNSKNYKIYEKIDGFLGIMYWINGLPFITTRDSFVSFPAIRATSILYCKYCNIIKDLNPNFTYLFEIIFPNDYLIINYGEIEDLYLIGIYDNNNNIEIPLDEIELPFPKPQLFETEHNGLDELLKLDIKNKEGLVVKFENEQRIKIKFPTYKEIYEKRYFR